MGKRDIIIVCTAVVLALVLAAFRFFAPSVETGAWGLHFGEKGAAPSGPVSGAQLKELGAHYVGDTQEKVLYLTFDAGYENGSTEKILDTLKKHNAPAAFFLVGNYVEKNQDLVRRMVAVGHIVGNHTMHHPDMTKKTDPQSFQKELQDLEALFWEVTGRELSKFYRPPQGLYSEDNLKLAHQMGYTTVFWSLAYADWNKDAQPTREQAFGKLLPRVHNGAIVLLHSTSQTNAAILDELLTKWESMGYRFASLTELQ